MIHNLFYFNVPEFPDEFLVGMKEELPSTLNLVTTYYFDSESIDYEDDKYQDSSH